MHGLFNTSAPSACELDRCAAGFLDRYVAFFEGVKLGVDIGSAKLPPVFGDAELGVDLETLAGTAAFENLDGRCRRRPPRLPGTSTAVRDHRRR